MGMRIDMVPQLVPVENETKAEAKNTKKGMSWGAKCPERMDTR